MCWSALVHHLGHTRCTLKVGKWLLQFGYHVIVMLLTLVVSCSLQHQGVVPVERIPGHPYRKYKTHPPKVHLFPYQTVQRLCSCAHVQSPHRLVRARQRKHSLQDPHLSKPPNYLSVPPTSYRSVLTKIWIHQGVFFY